MTIVTQQKIYKGKVTVMLENEENYRSIKQK